VPRSPLVRAAAIVAAVLLVAAGWYLGSPLFIRTTANEPLPAAARSVTDAPASSAVATGPAVTGGTTAKVVLSGQLRYVDALHNGTGNVLLIDVPVATPAGGQHLLRFADVAITNAPDVHVYLSKERGGRWSEATSVYLGPLKATNGSFNYDIGVPFSASEYLNGSVVVWCRAFSVLITWADLAMV
jgi:hypothetical protein